MTGVSSAVITNLTAAVAGFSGDITGLTSATETAASNGQVGLGTAGDGLNTALLDVTISASHNFTAHMTAAALAAATGPATVTLTGVGAAGTNVVVGLDGVTGVTTGYASLVVDSAGSVANFLTLNANEGAGSTNTATLTVTGAEALVISGSALNIDNLHTFTGNGTTPDTGGVDAIFANADGLGHVDATGGSGVNTFEFGDVAATGLASFTTTSTVDGGTGVSNTLIIDATNGAILNTGVGPNITGIATIEHSGAEAGALTADLALMGSATTFDLAGTYSGAGVIVTDITNAMTVEYSGSGAVLTLEHASPGSGQFINFVMNQTAMGGTLDLPELIVPVQSPVLNVVNLDSMGNAATNHIDNISNVEANITVTGDTPLVLGTLGAPYDFTGALTTGGGAVIDASGDTGGVEVWLGPVARPNFPNPSQTFDAGTGTDTVHLLNFEATVVNFSPTGTDTVDFHEARFSGAGLLSNSPAPPTSDGSTELYNSVNGWVTANDTIDITNSGGFSITGALLSTNGAAPALGASSILNFTTGAAVDAHAVADNWIKISTATATTGATAQAGVRQRDRC